MIPFSIQEMTSALEAIGYEIKEEQITVDESKFNTYKQEKTYTLFQPYYRGQKMVEWDRGFGTRRIEYCFNHELQKRLLDLFK